MEVSAAISAGLLEFAPILIERDDSITRVPQVGTIRSRDRGLPLHHTLITGNEERLGLRELLLPRQARAEQALAVVSTPTIRCCFFVVLQRGSERGFGLGIPCCRRAIRPTEAWLATVSGCSFPSARRRPSMTLMIKRLGLRVLAFIPV